MSLWSSWQVWAVLSALFAALTAIFAKVGIAFLGERLSGPNWLGIALIAAGAVLVAYR